MEKENHIVAVYTLLDFDRWKALYFHVLESRMGEQWVENTTERREQHERLSTAIARSYPSPLISAVAKEAPKYDPIYGEKYNTEVSGFISST